MIRKLAWLMLWFVGTALILIVALFLYNTRIIESGDPADLAPASTRFVDIGGERIAYSEINNHASTTVIFVGGLSAWNGTWDRVVQEVNKKRSDLNFIAIDLPPFGYSHVDLSKGFYRDVQSERIASFIEHKKLENVILVGHSYGAGPVTEYVFNHEERVQKLILIDAVLNIDETKEVSSGVIQIGLLRSLLIGTFIHHDAFALSRLKSFVFITDHVDQALLDTYTNYFHTKGVTSRFSVWLRDYVNDPLNYMSNASENYTKLSVPVRLIWGDKDTLTPIEGATKLLTSVPDITLTTLHGVGHIPMIENYALFDEALVEALGK